MPAKFEKEKIDVTFERVDIQGMELLAAKVRSIRPSVTFRSMQII